MEGREVVPKKLHTESNSDIEQIRDVNESMALKTMVKYSTQMFFQDADNQ